jgi:uncharacterized membrane protein
MTRPEPDRRARSFFALLVGILVVYALIVGLGNLAIGRWLRVLVLGLVLVGALRIGRGRRLTLVTAALVVLLGLAFGVLGEVYSPNRALNAASAITEATLVGTAIGVLVRTIWAWRRVETATVLGVLCVYLLLALFFANLHLLGAALKTPYFHGADQPDYADCLYFSVTTLTTTGLGDLTPDTQFGRTLTITEALLGQLYLVSVVAAVVGGWTSTAQRG